MSKELQTAFVFPGQGSQRVGMGAEIFQQHEVARRTYEEASDTLGINLAQLCFEDSEEKINDTRFTQPALLVTTIAAHRVLREQGITPDQVAGHSLGEYSALVAAEALSFSQAIQLVKARGEYMSDAGQQNPGKMAAILKLPIDQVREICEQSRAEIANINSESQIVIAGKNDSVDYASKLVTDHNGKAIGLSVSIASHCSLMEPAQQQMELLLETAPIEDPKIPVVINVTGGYVRTANEVRRGLVDQMTGSVLWLDSVKLMIKNGAQQFIEVGPGNVLTNLIKRIDSSVPAESMNV